MPQYEFGSGDKEIADSVREEYNDHLSARDDKRTLTVRIATDAPEGVKTDIEARATESKREADSRSVMGAPLSEGVREKIKKFDGFSRNNTVFSWRKAKGVFQREGLMQRWGESISSLAKDYDDPAEGAEEIIKRGRQADAQKGTSSVSGEYNAGEEDVQEDMRQARGARRVQSEYCNHAEDFCKNGDQEACEELQEVCGYDADMTEELLNEGPGSLGVGADTNPDPDSEGSEATESQQNDSESDDAGQPDIDSQTVDDASDWDTSQLTGKEAGALSRNLQGYYGATDQIEESIEEYLKPEWDNAQRAANNIQEIRMKYDAGRQHFEKLEDLQAKLLDFVEQMAQDCRECHADHSGHDHDVTASEREDVRNFAEGGGNATPVGAADETEAAAMDAPDRTAGMEMETIDPQDRQANASQQQTQQYDRMAGMEMDPADPNNRIQTAYYNEGTLPADPNPIYSDTTFGEMLERKIVVYLTQQTNSSMLDSVVDIAARQIEAERLVQNDIKQAVEAANYIAGVGNRINPADFIEMVQQKRFELMQNDTEESQATPDRMAGMQSGALPGSRERVEGAAARARANERQDIESRLTEPTANPNRVARNRQREIQSMDADISGNPREIFDRYYEANTEDTRTETREYERTPNSDVRPYSGDDKSAFMQAEQQRSDIEVRGNVAEDMRGKPNDHISTVPGLGDGERALMDMGITTVAELYQNLDRAIEEVPDETSELVKRYAFNSNSYRHTPVPNNIPSQVNPDTMTAGQIDRMAGMRMDAVDPRNRRANVRQSQPQATGMDPQAVMDSESQQTLGGSRSDPQRTFGTNVAGQPKQRDSEIEESAKIDEVNSGGLMADQRSADATEITKTTDDATEQQIPEEFVTREDGNQQSIDDVSTTETGTGTENSEMSLDTAIEMLDGMTDGYGDRVSMDAALAELLVEKFDVPQSVWSEKNSQDVFRYGIPAEDTRQNLSDEYQSQIEDAIIRLAQEQRAVQ